MLFTRLERFGTVAGPEKVCGGDGQQACEQEPFCECGLLPNASGLCQQTGTGCLEVEAVSTGPGVQLNRFFCA
jgi:hypothetical protein